MKNEKPEDVYEALARDAHEYRGRLLDTELALWTGMLALNGLAIAAATAFATIVGTDGKVIALLITVFMSFVSACLIFGNFTRRRKMYRTLSRSPDLATCASDAAFAQDLNRMAHDGEKHRVDEETNRCHEWLAIRLVLVSLIVIVATVYAKVCGL